MFFCLPTLCTYMKCVEYKMNKGFWVTWLCAYSGIEMAEMNLFIESIRN